MPRYSNYWNIRNGQLDSLHEFAKSTANKEVVCMHGCGKSYKKGEGYWKGSGNWICMECEAAQLKHAADSPTCWLCGEELEDPYEYCKACHEEQ